MDYYEQIASHCQGTIETIAMSVDHIADRLQRGCDLMTSALLDDGKIIACGNGADGALAQLFVSNLLGRFEQERPALPALSLGADSASLTGIIQSNSVNEIFSRQLRALGQPGDVLLCINSGGSSPSLLRAVQAALERNMTVLLLSNDADTELGTLIRAEDVELRIEAPHQAQLIEVFTLVLNCCCELIEQNLFGDFQQD
ncbi:MAG: phosphoheptose isomerase [Bacteroidia bacterium]|jgi:phosphoheptose isomerase